MNIGFIGLGRLGKAVAVTVDYMGHSVFGYDINPRVMNHETVGAIENGPFGTGDLNEYLKKSNIVYSSMQEVIEKSEIIFVAIQTPHEPSLDGTRRLTEERKDFDYSFLINSIKQLSECEYKEDKVIAVISTVLPGTIREHIVPLLNPRMKLVFNPFFIAQNTVAFDFLNPEFVLLGVDDVWAKDKVREFYKTIHGKPVIEMSIESAELTKVAYNLFITMKINFANAIGQIAHYSGADINTVMNALKQADSRLVSTRYMDMGMADSGGCFLSGHIIYCEDGFKYIEDVKAGDKVLAENGKFQEVIDVYRRNYKGKVHKIKARGLPQILATEEHPIYVSKDTRGTYITNGKKGKKIKKWYTEEKGINKLGPIEQIEAKNVNNDYYLISPVANVQEQYLIPQWANLEYVRLGGFYLSEGSIEKDKRYPHLRDNGERVSFHFNENETEFHEEVINLMKLLEPNRKVGYNKDEESKGLSLRFYSPEICDKFTKDFSVGCFNKKIPNWILYGDLKWSMALLQGMWLGDGHSCSSGLALSTSSKDLAYGTSVILKRLDIPHSVNRIPRRLGKDKVFHQETWEIMVNNGAYMEQICSLTTMPNLHQMQKKKYKYVIFSKDNVFYHKVQKVSEFDYDGDVYNLNVADTHNYVCEGALVHNCHPRDALAMSYATKSYNLPYDLFESAMLCRENYTEWLAEITLSEAQLNDLPIMVLGKAFKPECSVVSGSCSILLMNIMKERLPDYKIDIYDPFVHRFGFEQVLDKPKCYFIGTKHNCFKRYTYPTGSIIIDPHRYIPDIAGVKVIRLGESNG